MVYKAEVYNDINGYKVYNVQLNNKSIKLEQIAFIPLENIQYNKTLSFISKSLVWILGIIVSFISQIAQMNDGIIEWMIFIIKYLIPISVIYLYVFYDYKEINIRKKIIKILDIGNYKPITGSKLFEIKEIGRAHV